MQEMKLRTTADGMLTAHNGKKYPAQYDYNYSYRPVIDGVQLVRDAREFLGVEYVLGGESHKGIDCSGLTRVCLARQGIDVVHRASLQALEGRYVQHTDLRPGDLVYFRDDKTERYLSHVGIYVGNNKFIHASGSYGKVVITSLSKDYYKSHYAFARRL
jgi:cell wall-associated NlpC family hydrolase